MSKKKVKRRFPAVLTETLYCYVEKANKKRAQARAEEFGSHSNYVNYLIARDSGDKASMERSVANKKKAAAVGKKVAKVKKSKRHLSRKLSRKTKPQKSSHTKKFLTPQSKSKKAKFLKVSIPAKKFLKLTSKNFSAAA